MSLLMAIVDLLSRFSINVSSLLLLKGDGFRCTLNDRVFSAEPTLSRGLISLFANTSGEIDLDLGSQSEIFSTINSHFIDVFPSYPILKEIGVVLAVLEGQRTRSNRINTLFFLNESNEGFSLKYFPQTMAVVPGSKSRILSGVYFTEKLRQYVENKNVLEYYNILENLFDHVIEKHTVKGELHESTLEMIPKNCIISQGGFEFFDLEFVGDRRISISYYIFRSIITLQKAELLRSADSENRLKMYKNITRKLNIKSDLFLNIWRETIFRQKIYRYGVFHCLSGILRQLVR